MRKIIIIGIISVVFISCSKTININGQWENNERILKFNEYGQFTIEYKQPKQIQAFQGSYVQKNNIIVLLFEEYKTDRENWNYTDETDLEGHKEVLQVSITDNQLHTKIVSTGKEYIYIRKRN